MRTPKDIITYCFGLFSRREKRDYAVCLCLGIIAASTELLGLGSLVPIISLFTDYDGAIKNEFIGTVYRVFGEPSQWHFLVAITAISCLTILSSILVNLAYSFAGHRFARRVAARLSTEALIRYLSLPLDRFEKISQADLLRNIDGVGNWISNGVLLTSLHILTRVWLLTLVLMILLYVNPKLTTSIVVVLCCIYFIVHRVVKSKIAKIAQENLAGVSKLNQFMLDTYSSYRQITIDRLGDSVIDNFSSVKRNVCRKEANIEVMGEMPRYVLEGGGLIILIISALALSLENNQYLIANMTVFALAAYRVLPALQQIYHCVNRVHWALGASSEIETVFGYPEPPVQTGSSSTTLERLLGEVSFENVSYRYSAAESSALSNFSSVFQDKRVTLIKGASGTGKSTLIDLLLGLRDPSDGDILIGDKPLEMDNLTSWWQEISYVPQKIHFFGNSIRESITNLPSNIDEAHYEKILRGSGIRDLLDSRSIDEKTTAIRECNFSGGELARLAIARALYKKSRLVIMDEPFAALDFNSAQTIFNWATSEFPDRGFVIISHREDELSRIDDVVTL